MTNMEKKLRILLKLYALHADYSDSLSVSCKERCSGCCTRNVTITSLEALNIITGIGESKRKYMTEKITAAAEKPCYRPQLTTNGWAAAIARGENPPDEENDPAWGKCPVIEDDLCPVYNLRPFGCRALVSESPCMETGYADVSPFTLTINHVFMQYIEYLDAGGISGNFSDIWLFITHGDHLITYGSGKILKIRDSHLLRNHPPKMLLVPPEHQGRIRELLKSINGLF